LVVVGFGGVVVVVFYDWCELCLLDFLIILVYVGVVNTCINVLFQFYKDSGMVVGVVLVGGNVWVL